MSEPWSALFSEIGLDGPDYRWAGPTHACLCGCDQFAAIVKFDEGKIGFYFLDVRCASCHAYLIAPTEVDDEQRSGT